MCGGYGFKEAPPFSINVVAYENDQKILPYLKETIEWCGATCRRAGIFFKGEIREEDFIAAAIAQSDEGLFAIHGERFTHAILNPLTRRSAGNRKLADCSMQQGLRYPTSMQHLYGYQLNCWNPAENWWQLRPEVSVMAPTSAGLEWIS